MKSRSFFSSILVFAVLNGLLCGYVLGYIAGILPIFEKSIHLTGVQVSLVAGAILLGCFLSSIFTGFLSDYMGRKMTIIITLLFYLSGIFLFIFSGSFNFVYASRLLQGLGFGMAVIVIPLYLTEVSTKNQRGRIITSFQLSLTGGVLVSNLFNLFLASNVSWREITIILFLYTLFVLYYTLKLPESPRWLYNHRTPEAARTVLDTLNSKFNNPLEWESINISSNKDKLVIKEIFTKKSNLIPLSIVTAAVCLNQLSGINGFLQCSVTILKDTGISSDIIGLIGGVSITSINFLATILTLIFVERLGRKKILILGTFALLIVLIALSIINFSLPNTPVKGYITLVGIVLIVGFFAFGPGGVILVLCSELLPNKIRSIGLTISFTIGALVGMFFVSLFLPISHVIGFSGLFILIAFFVFCYLIIGFKIPETKGKSLEEIEQEYSKK